jgi:hypothetical protein
MWSRQGMPLLMHVGVMRGDSASDPTPNTQATTGPAHLSPTPLTQAGGTTHPPISRTHQTAAR